MALPERTRVQMLAPVIRGKKGEHSKVFEDARKQGYVRVRVDGEVLRPVRRNQARQERKSTASRSSSTALVIRPDVARPPHRLGRDRAVRWRAGWSSSDVIGGEELRFSQNYACDDCGISIEELTPRMFSFNNPVRRVPGLHRPRHSEASWTPTCVIPNRRPLHQAGRDPRVRLGRTPSRDSISQHVLRRRSARSTALRSKRPLRNCPEQALDELLYGTEERDARADRSAALRAA